MNRTKPLQTLALLLVTLLLGACAATPRPQAAAADPSELAGLQQKLEENEARYQRLQDSLVMLEVRLLDQQRLIEKLQQQVAGGEFTPASSVGSDASARQDKSPTQIYLDAFGDYASGNYRKSIQGFTAFLRHFPTNDYAGNARYWLAECYLAQEEYEQASIEFERVYNEFPQGSKAADAMLKRAAAQHQLGQSELAMETLQLLQERYPKSAAARRAEQANQ